MSFRISGRGPGRSSRLALSAAALGACLAAPGVFAGCGEIGTGLEDAGVQYDFLPPPAICKTPPATPAAPWFNDVTSQVLPQASDPKTAPTANTLQSGDLDGDGYPDLIATGGEGFPERVMAGTNTARRDEKGKRTRLVFMNRPDPSDAARRIFVDATETTGLRDTRDGKGGYAYGVTNIGDVDNDGDNDVVVGPSDPGGADHDPDDPGGVFLNDGKGHFSLVESGELEAKVIGFGPATSTLLDFDADGVLDWLPGTFVYPPPNTVPPVLFHGAGNGQFIDVAALRGLPSECLLSANAAPTCSPNYGLTACDIDMDGDQDILFASYGREPNQVWRNDGTTFVEIGVATGLAYDHRVDFSDDQSYRCYCANRPGKCVPQPPDPYDPNYCTFAGGKDGRGWFPGSSDTPWRLGGNNYSLVCADVDNDGDMDIMTSTIRHADVGSVSDPSEMCFNDSPPGTPLGKFRRPGPKETGIDRSAFEVGFNWNEGDLTAQMVDVDNDGLKDVYICSSDYPGDHGWLFQQQPDGKFKDMTTASKIGQKESHGIAFFDMDKDGDLDVAIGTSTFRGGAPYAVLKVYENIIGQDQNWLQIQLVGKGSGSTNKSAIGALVKVTAGGKTQQMEISGGHSASATQNELILTFGLGAACTVDKVEVRWLDGKKTVATYKDVRPNYRVRIIEGSDFVEYFE